MGVDDLNQIDGYYGSGASSDPAHAFTALRPYTQFHSLDYPGAADSYATSMSDNRIYAGYFVDSADGGHTWGWMRNRGVWNQYKDYQEPKGDGTVTELLGVNRNAIGVGFYVNAHGQDEPFELAENKYRALDPPGFITATANGIDMKGIIVGTETLSNATTQGWLLNSQTYYEFSFPNSNDTQVYGINFQLQVVGSYVDGSGATHGFILTNPTSTSNKYWQSVDEPNAAGTTVITSMNDHHTISGWYVDSSGNTNGFVGILTNTK